MNLARAEELLNDPGTVALLRELLSDELGRPVSEGTARIYILLQVAPGDGEQR